MPGASLDADKLFRGRHRGRLFGVGWIQLQKIDVLHFPAAVSTGTESRPKSCVFIKFAAALSPSLILKISLDESGSLRPQNSHEAVCGCKGAAYKAPSFPTQLGVTADTFTSSRSCCESESVKEKRPQSSSLQVGSLKVAHTVKSFRPGLLQTFHLSFIWLKSSSIIDC